MPNYTSIGEMKLRIGSLNEDPATVIALDAAINAAEAAVEDYCGRVFTTTSVASARVFVPRGGHVFTDDISSTSGLIVADTGTTYAGSTYQLEPLNGIGRNGRPWPYEAIRLVNGAFFVFPIYVGQATVTITAKWGWPSVPEPVIDAVRILAGDLYRMKDNQFGVAGFGEMGVLRIRENATVANMLAIYRRASHVFGIA